MPDLKLGAVIEAAYPRALEAYLVPFFGTGASEVRLDATRVEPPDGYWAVYRLAERRVVLRSFLREREYLSYITQLKSIHPDRYDHPEHPEGGILPVPDLNGFLWAFPFDPSMPDLPRCFDVGWVAETMRRRGRKPLVAETVSYRPEIGALVRYRVEGSRRPLAYAKVSPAETAGLVYAVMNRLWNSGERVSGRLALAQPLAFRPSMGLLIQSAVPGKILDGQRNRKAFFELASHAGSALAALQGTDTPFGPRYGVERLLQRLDARLEEAKLLAPRLYPTLRDLIAQIQERAKKERFDVFVPSHGDYKWDQFLEWRGRYSLIDFEYFCQADPAYDAGYFCAYLPPSRPDDWRDSAAGEYCRSAFLTAYAAKASVEAPWSRVALYEAGMLAIRGFSYVWSRRSGWEQQAAQLLDLGFERLVNPGPGPLPQDWFSD